jgi:mannose-6-phosphate isomerase-like protein (cupin superfamily)
MASSSDFRPLGEDGWSKPEGYPDGVEVKVLAGALDPESRTGRRTTMSRWKPGTHVPWALVHDYVEEVLVLEGELLWLDEDGAVVDRILPPSYVCRPAGVPHGPFRTGAGYLSVEFCYYPAVA